MIGLKTCESNTVITKISSGKIVSVFGTLLMTIMLLSINFVLLAPMEDNFTPIPSSEMEQQDAMDMEYLNNLLDTEDETQIMTTRAGETIKGTSQWDSEVLGSFNGKTSGCTIGDLDPTRTGNEVITANSDGLVALLYQDKSGNWKTQDLWQGEGELITAVIADFYSGHEGNELAVVGMAKGLEGEGAGQATMIYGSGDTWKADVMYVNQDSMLHGLAVGDLDPNHPGNELIIMSFGFDVKMLTWNGSSATDWNVTQMWRAEGKVRKGVIDDIDPNHSGNELVVVDKSGNCTMITGSGTIWNATTLWKDPGTPGLARVTIGNVDPTYSGKEIIVGGDSSNVGIIRRTGSNWDGKVIFTDEDKIRGLGVGDVDPTHKGNEILVFGYSKNVTLITGSGDIWKSRTIFTDTDRAHDLAVGEFDLDHTGLEFVIVGYSNNVTMVGVSPWYYNIMFTDTSKVSGCTIGDLDPTRPGNEVISASGNGRVIMIYKDGDVWNSIDLWQGEGELITPVIGEFYSPNPGNELVLVGMAKGSEGEGAGQVTMIYGSGDTWKAEIMYVNEDSMLHGLAVGDIDPNHPGNEVIVMSFGFDAKMLIWDGPKATDWNVTQMWHAEGKVRKGVIDDIDPNHPGNELVVVDKSGNCTMLTGSGDNWTATTLWTDPGTPGLARVAVGDIDPTYPGKEIIVGGDSTNVGIIRRSGNSWEGKVIYSDSDKIRGLGVGDVDQIHLGNELLVYGYSQKVTMLTGSGNTWNSRVVYTDSGRGHDLAVGEFDSSHNGQEIVFGGYSNSATMVFNSELTEISDFSMYAYPTSQTIKSGETVEFTIGVLALSGFNNQVRFTLNGLPDTYSYNFYPTTIIPDSETKLTIKVPNTKTSEELSLTIQASSGVVTYNQSLTLNVLGDTIAPSIDYTKPDNEEENVPTGQPIVIRFSEPINKATISANGISIIEDDSKTEYTGTLDYISGSNTLIISEIHEKNSPSIGLPNSKLIKVSLDIAIEDLAGNTMSAKYNFKYLTSEIEYIFPGALEIRYVYPDRSQTGVPPETPIVIEFNVPMDQNTLTWNNIKIISDTGNDYMGKINYDHESYVLTLTDLKTSDGNQMGFLNDSKMTISLSTNIKTSEGKALTDAYSWTFQVGSLKDVNGDGDGNGQDNEIDSDIMLMSLFLAIVIIIFLFLMLLATLMKLKNVREEADERIKKAETKKAGGKKGGKKSKK